MLDNASSRYSGRTCELIAVCGIGFAFVGLFVFLPLLFKVSSTADTVALIAATAICLAGIAGSARLMSRHERSIALLIFWFAQLFVLITPVLKFDLALFCMARVGVSLERLTVFGDVAFGGWVSYGIFAATGGQGARVAVDLIPLSFLILIFAMTGSTESNK